jgi:hypothetical protein
VDQFDRARGHCLNRYLIGIATFELVRWKRDNLAAVYVIPYFVRFKQWIEAEPVNPPTRIMLVTPHTARLPPRMTR